MAICPPPRWLSLALACTLLPGVAADPSRFENEVRALERRTDLPRGGIVFLGSSTFRLWKTLERDFPGQPVVNCGFGGSHLSDALHFLDRLVLPLAPRQVLLYEGDNDLADGKSPAEILRDFQQLVGRIHARLPDTRIGFVAVKPSPARRQWLEAQRELNRQVQAYIATDPRLTFVDTFHPMLDNRGEPCPELYASDRLHLSEAGYQLWASVVRPVLQSPP